MPSAETLNHLLTLCSYRNRCTPLLEAHLWGKVHASGRALLLSLGLQPSSQAQLSAWDSLRNTSARGLKVTQFPNNAYNLLMMAERSQVRGTLSCLSPGFGVVGLRQAGAVATSAV